MNKKEFWTTIAAILTPILTVLFFGYNSIMSRFEAVDKQFETVDKRFEAVDKRFEMVDKQFEAVDKRFEAINQHLIRLESKFDKVIEIQSKQGERIARLEAEKLMRLEKELK